MGRIDENELNNCGKFFFCLSLLILFVLAFALFVHFFDAIF